MAYEELSVTKWYSLTSGLGKDKVEQLAIAYFKLLKDALVSSFHSISIEDWFTRKISVNGNAISAKEGIMCL